MSQRIIIVDSPDGCGKTEISKELARCFSIPYFKVDSEKENWAKDSFKNSLWFDRVLPQFLSATGTSYVSDRGYPSEVVYASVFGRNTDSEMLIEIDNAFARINTIIVMPLRRDYSVNREDELVSNDKLTQLHYGYIDFCNTTSCSVVKIYVDDYDNNLKKECNQIIPVIDELRQSRHVTTNGRLIKRIVEL